jgi:hypothetical protein
LLPTSPSPFPPPPPCIFSAAHLCHGKPIYLLPCPPALPQDGDDDDDGDGDDGDGDDDDDTVKKTLKV